MKYNVISSKDWIIGLSFIVVFVVATVLKLFGVLESYQQFVAVLISAAATYIIIAITMGKQSEQQKALMEKQSASDEEKEKNAKVFEEKLRIYQDFLHCLCDVIKDGEVTKEEAIELEFQTSYITMHTNSEHIKTIAQQVKKIVENLGDKVSGNAAEKADLSNAAWMQGLFTIVNEFKKELYHTIPSEQDVKNTAEAVKSFSSIIEAVEVSKSESVDVLTTDEASVANLKQNLTDFTQELVKQLDVNEDLWKLEIGDLATGVKLKIAQKGNEDGVHIILNHEDNGEQYFQIHLDFEDTREAYKHLKWRFGGRQNQWSWWKYLDEAMRNLAATDEIKTGKWNTLLNHIVKQLKALVNYVETFERIRNDIYRLAPTDKANVSMYYETVVAFDFEKTLGNDRLFMDVVLQDNGLYTIVFGDRDSDVQKLVSRLNVIGFSVNESDLQEDRYKAYADITAEEAITKVKEINSKIQ